MSQLFSPLQIKGITLKNRIVVSPMCMYSSEDGFANDWHMVHLGTRAVGGASLVFTEATAVTPDGRISPQDLGIWKDEHIEKLKQITTFIESQGAVPGMQIAHAGRKSSETQPWNGSKPVPIEQGGWQTIAPSAVPYKEGLPVPREMSADEIHEMVGKFRDAAGRALKAGFKVLELHGAHGYLIHEFLSPYSNKRTDEYGGSFENRSRFLMEIVAAVHEVWPADLPLFVRISATDHAEGGWTIEESVQLAHLLKAANVDLIDCSSGGNVNGVRYSIGPLYQAHFAEQIKQEAGIMTGAVGLITTAEEAESIIAGNRADVVLLARQMLRDPYFPQHAARELGVDIKWPDQYLRAKLK
jgi:2,4-dienoyl-CoA reductase-like NADH-dependent reductase (Old Yellow Enzyme family)